MSDQPDTFVSSFLPEVEAPEPDELDESLDPDELDDDAIEVEEGVVPPLGRSWAFDFMRVGGPGHVTIQGRGPLEVTGLSTLRGWIEKCLRTPRGSSPIHPYEYGVENLDDFIGQGLETVSLSDMAQRITDALTYHPRITDVEDFQFESDEVNEALFVSFTVVVDHENDRFDIPIESFPLA